MALSPHRDTSADAEAGDLLPILDGDLRGSMRQSRWAGLVGLGEELGILLRYTIGRNEWSGEPSRPQRGQPRSAQGRSASR